MIIEVAKNDLKENLDIAQATLGNGPDITSHFLFEKIGETVFISSCNPPRLFSSVPLKGIKVEGEGDFTIEGKRLLQSINAVEGLLKIECEEGNVTIKSDRGSISFPSLDPSAFPPWRGMFGDAEEKVSISADVLSDTISSTRPYASVDEARRPELAMINFTGGNAFACDGFGLAMARSDDFNQIDLKIHVKDTGAVLKFLKAYEGNTFTQFSSDQAVFLKAEDGGMFGMTSIPFEMPTAITTKYIEAFGWTPRRVWRLSKNDMTNALNFLISGASDSDYKVNMIDPESELINPPRLEMTSLSGKKNISYTLEEVEYEEEVNADFDVESVADLADRMYVSRKVLSLKGEDEESDIESFSFNYKYMKRALDVSDKVVNFGCNKEGEKRGYMIFKQSTPSLVEITCIVGWMV